MAPINAHGGVSIYKLTLPIHQCNGAGGTLAMGVTTPRQVMPGILSGRVARLAHTVHKITIVPLTMEFYVCAHNITDGLVSFPRGYLALTPAIPFVFAPRAALFSWCPTPSTLGVFQKCLDIEGIVPLCKSFHLLFVRLFGFIEDYFPQVFNYLFPILLDETLSHGAHLL